MLGPVRENGSLNEATVVLLHAIAGVNMDLLRAARIRPSSSNWLRAPWYRYHRGGAIQWGAHLLTRIGATPVLGTAARRQLALAGPLGT